MTKVVSVERFALTQEHIDNHPYEKKPWCKLCSKVKVYSTKRDPWSPKGYRITAFQYIPTFIEVDSRVVRITYSNNTLAYYHETCYDKDKEVKSSEQDTAKDERTH